MVQLAELRHRAEAQHYSSGDVHAVKVRPSDLLALIEAATAGQKLVHHTYHHRGSAVHTSGHGRLLKDALSRFDFGELL